MCLEMYSISNCKQSIEKLLTVSRVGSIKLRYYRCLYLVVLLEYQAKSMLRVHIMVHFQFGYDFPVAKLPANFRADVPKIIHETEGEPGLVSREIVTCPLAHV
jgi:hypothetical protein